MYFGHQDVNNLLSKLEELRTLVFNKNISLFGITETKLDNTVSNEELKIDGCNLLRSDRNRNGRKVACYIKNKIVHNQQSSISEVLFYITTCTKIHHYGQGIIYRPNQVDIFYHFNNYHFNNALGKLTSQSNEIYLLGDFNINLFLKIML